MAAGRLLLTTVMTITEKGVTFVAGGTALEILYVSKEFSLSSSTTYTLRNDISVLEAIGNNALQMNQTGQWCYNCHFTPLTNACVYTTGDLLRSGNTVMSVLSDNGTIEDALIAAENVALCEENMPYCVIEEIIIDGQVILYYRDCSDGIHFSVPLGVNSRLINLRGNNITTCDLLQLTNGSSYVGEVCLTLCQGDFCNGPYVNVNRAGGMPRFSLLNSLCIALVTFKMVLCKQFV